MNKKAQGLGAGIFLGILIGIFGVLLLGSAGIITGFISCGTENCDCQFVTREANYEIVGDSEFSGKTTFSSDFKVKLENKENQAANFKVNMLCNTAKDSTTIISSDQIYVQPHSVGEFEIEYSVGMFEDWQCSLSSVESGIIDSCESV